MSVCLFLTFYRNQTVNDGEAAKLDGLLRAVLDGSLKRMSP